MYGRMSHTTSIKTLKSLYSKQTFDMPRVGTVGTHTQSIIYT